MATDTARGLQVQIRKAVLRIQAAKGISDWTVTTGHVGPPESSLHNHQHYLSYNYRSHGEVRDVYCIPMVLHPEIEGGYRSPSTKRSQYIGGNRSIPRRALLSLCQLPERYSCYVYQQSQEDEYDAVEFYIAIRDEYDANVTAIV
ncbi:hypothetical protein CBS147310_6077 [Penicillium roqueforti]|nr:hypothetical protein CBS147310_6077 [Penicillium roqueforti]